MSVRCGMPRSPAWPTLGRLAAACVLLVVPALTSCARTDGHPEPDLTEMLGGWQHTLPVPGDKGDAQVVKPATVAPPWLTTDAAGGLRLLGAGARRPDEALRARPHRARPARDVRGGRRVPSCPTRWASSARCRGQQGCVAGWSCASQGPGALRGVGGVCEGVGPCRWATRSPRAGLPFAVPRRCAAEPRGRADHAATVRRRAATVRRPAVRAASQAGRALRRVRGVCEA